MPDGRERVLANARAARVTLEPNSAERIANSIAPIEAQLLKTPFQVELEHEPATYIVIQRAGAKR
jgi:hypothetical protein